MGSSINPHNGYEGESFGFYAGGEPLEEQYQEDGSIEEEEEALDTNKTVEMI